MTMKHLNINKESSSSANNVFADIGFKEPEATILALRSDLMMKIEDMIKERGLSQSEAAAILGVSQSRVSDLMRGKFNKFSLDMLITFATRLGKNVELLVA